MSTMKLDIEKFDMSINFGLWQLKMKAILIQNGVHKALEGKVKKPATMTEEKWEEVDLKVLSAIQLCLSNEVLREVAKESTAAELWLKLESLYMAKSVTNRLLLKSRLYDLRLEEGNSLKSHLDEFFSIVMDLQNIDVILDDEDLAIYLLCSLPPSYKHFRETILYGRDDLSIDDVRDALTQRDLIDNQLASKSSNNSNDGLFVRGRNNDHASTSNGGNGGKNKGRSKSKKPNPNRNKTCNYCHIKGHIKVDCWKWQKKQSGDAKSGKDKEQHNTAEASFVDIDSDSGALVATNDKFKGRSE